MGRRSINTTKSGKYMNPTDQARKEARKKELKKNKKQRQMVRAAVLKGKDPSQIIEEMEKIDEMEYNVHQPSPLNEKVLKEKRKKLKETLERVLKLYDKDEPEQWAELKRREIDYEKRRNKLVAYYESVKHAQSVQIDDIPLPSIQIPDNMPPMYSIPAQIPLPALPQFKNKARPTGILKKTMSHKKPSSDKTPPGVPPCPPPPMDVSDDESSEPSLKSKAPSQKSIRFSDDIVENEDTAEKATTALTPAEIAAKAVADGLAPKPTSLQQRMLALSGQNIDEFMKEMEVVQRKREQDRSADLTARLSSLAENQDDKPPGEEDEVPPRTQQTILPVSISGGQLGLPPPPPLMFRPLRMPPGPPPGRPNLPPGPPPGMPPRLPLRLPPGPPPGMPPRLLRPPMLNRMPINISMSVQKGQTPQNNVLSAAPQLINRNDGKGSATIMAKPQIRNLSADVTRFVPSTLRIKREDKKVKHQTKLGFREIQQEPKHKPDSQTKDEAYYQFMNEMKGLL